MSTSTTQLAPAVMTGDWSLAKVCLVRDGEWRLPLQVLTDESTVRIVDATGRDVMVAGSEAVAVFKHTGSPKRIHMEQGID